MREVQRIEDQLRRAFEGNAWHGPAVREVLAGVPAAKAAAKPVAAAHSIWEVVLHVTAWEREALRLLRGDTNALPVLSVEEDWPPHPDRGAETWEETVRDLENVNRELRSAVSRIADEKLDEIVPGRDYSFYFLLHGLVQHALYHAGQMAILAKA